MEFLIFLFLFGLVALGGIIIMAKAAIGIGKLFIGIAPYAFFFFICTCIALLLK